MAETAGRHSQLNLRKTNPLLYHLIVTFAVGRVALAFNFWTSDPPFKPWNIPYWFTGVVFFILGAWQLVFLHVWRDFRKVRAVLALSAFVTFAWGLVNTHQFFWGPATLQLPIMFVTLAVVQLFCLISAPVNSTDRKS